jgi:hypothetical protein
VYGAALKSAGGELSGDITQSALSKAAALTLSEKCSEPADEEDAQNAWPTVAVSTDYALPLLPATDIPETRAVRRWSTTRLMRRSLLWLNQTYDRATTCLGWPGKWFRSAVGRHLLGLTGILLFALAILWCLHDWLGWTWPIDSLE